MTRLARALAFITTLAAATSLAHAGTPPSIEDLVQWLNSWKYNAQTKVWEYTAHSSSCERYMKEAEQAGVSDSLEVEVPYDTPEFKKGKRTVKQLKALCRHDMTTDQVRNFVHWVGLAANDKGDDIGKACLMSYDKIVKHLPGSTKLPYEGISYTDPATGDPFTGSLDDLKARFCAPQVEAAKAEQTKNEAPYRAALKGDKLELALEHYSFFLAGRVLSEDPKKLAKAKVWFREIEYKERFCANGGTVHIVYRYQFNAKHALVKSSEKNYCGAPPSKAYR